MAVRESLSPLMRNVQARRCSLEFCQKLGNQLLSPSAISGHNSTKSVPFNLSPHSPISPSTIPYRRGSADQGVLKALSPLTLCGNRGRRSSLTPLHNIASGQALINSHHQHYPIPSIHIQNATSNFSCSKGLDKTEQDSTKGGLLANIIPFCANENSDGKPPPFAQSPLQYGPSPCHQNSPRKSSLSLELDECLRLPLTSCHLKLNSGEVLGRGSFGTVIQGLYYGQRVAVKVIQTKLPSHLDSVCGEKNAHKIPHHPHIARVLNIYQIGSRALIVMELLRKGSLLTVLNDYRYPLDFLKMINFSGQIASALQFCHQIGILHLDVKPKNILLDGNDNCKLSDFGTSRKIQDIQRLPNSNQLGGTVAYRAPELFQGSKPTEKCDVYSFGVCMWQILQRENPYQGQREHQIIYQVVAQGLRPGKFTGSTNYNNNNIIVASSLLPQYISMYEVCWLVDPNLRPDMNSIVEQLLFLAQKVQNFTQYHA